MFPEKEVFPLLKSGPAITSHVALDEKPHLALVRGAGFVKVEIRTDTKFGSNSLIVAVKTGFPII